LTNIIEGNRILIFRKVSGDDAEKEGILGNWSQMEKLANYSISKDDIKEQFWTAEGEKALV
jgi:hypothetical protein